MKSIPSGNIPLAQLKYNTSSIQNQPSSLPLNSSINNLDNSTVGSFSSRFDSSLSNNLGTSTFAAESGVSTNPASPNGVMTTSTGVPMGNLVPSATASATATPTLLSASSSTNPGVNNSGMILPNTSLVTENSSMAGAVQNFLVNEGTISNTGLAESNVTTSGFRGRNIDKGFYPHRSYFQPKVVSVSDATATEGQKEIFTVGLSGTTTRSTTVSLNLAGGSATLGSDFEPALEASFDGGSTWCAVTNNCITLGAGIKNFQVRSQTIDDPTIESTEQYTLTASANGGTATGTATIIDNDVKPAPKVISVSNASATEGQQEVFTVGLSDPTTAPTNVALNLTSGTATIGEDVAPGLEASFDGGNTWSAVNSGTLSVGAGVKNFQVRTLAIDDSKVEPTETFSLTANGNGGNATGTGTILDNDRQPIKAQLVGNSSIEEGAQGSYSITLDTASDQDRIFTVAVNDGSAKRYDDDGSGQDFVWGGAFDIKHPATVFQNRVPNDNINGFNNRAAVGPGDASWDYSVYDSQGQINRGNTVTVKVAAGQTKSEQFAVKAWQEKVTVDLDYSNPNGLNATNYKEGTENFSLKIVDAGDTQVTNGNLNVSINDRTHYNLVSPIAIDLNGDGIKTVGIEQGVTFDILNIGQKVSTGWISGGDGLLAIDNNGNGKIDNRNELFGGGVGDGFAKLASFDSNQDGIVDAQDANFSKLKIWQDVNVNGTTDANELMSLTSAGIGSLNVAHTTDGFSRDAQNNLLGERGSAVALNGNSLETIDVYFQVNHG